ncbi:hypothetical protein PR048_007514 [Dryococelus australis]|uniref:Uncharacterized protein n=1 Tax=Dryococelus australis TaxID=614101 RepID=A0ABQ9HUF6_9NEOP|nr:hypothetical protein PR048_007514 [Dryococelus australis]
MFARHFQCNFGKSRRNTPVTPREWPARRRKRECPEKTQLPTATSAMFHPCKNSGFAISDRFRTCVANCGRKTGVGNYTRFVTKGSRECGRIVSSGDIEGMWENLVEVSRECGRTVSSGGIKGMWENLVEVSRECGRTVRSGGIKGMWENLVEVSRECGRIVSSGGIKGMWENLVEVSRECGRIVSSGGIKGMWENLVEVSRECGRIVSSGGIKGKCATTVRRSYFEHTLRNFFAPMSTTLARRDTPRTRSDTPLQRGRGHNLSGVLETRGEYLAARGHEARPEFSHGPVRAPDDVREDRRRVARVSTRRSMHSPCCVRSVCGDKTKRRFGDDKATGLNDYEDMRELSQFVLTAPKLTVVCTSQALPFWEDLGEILRADTGETRYEAAPECNGRPPRKPADQRHRPARIPSPKIRERPRRELNQERSSRCATAAPWRDSGCAETSRSGKRDYSSCNGPPSQQFLRVECLGDCAISSQDDEPAGRRVAVRVKSATTSICTVKNLICTVQPHDGNTARLARRSDEVLGVRVSVARIAPSLRDLGRGVAQFTTLFDSHLIESRGMLHETSIVEVKQLPTEHSTGLYNVKNPYIHHNMKAEVNQLPTEHSTRLYNVKNPYIHHNMKIEVKQLPTEHSTRLYNVKNLYIHLNMKVEVKQLPTEHSTRLYNVKNLYNMKVEVKQLPTEHSTLLYNLKNPYIHHNMKVEVKQLPTEHSTRLYNVKNLYIHLNMKVEVKQLPTEHSTLLYNVKNPYIHHNMKVEVKQLPTEHSTRLYNVKNPYNMKVEVKQLPTEHSTLLYNVKNTYIHHNMKVEVKQLPTEHSTRLYNVKNTYIHHNMKIVTKVRFMLHMKEEFPWCVRARHGASSVCQLTHSTSLSACANQRSEHRESLQYSTYVLITFRHYTTACQRIADIIPTVHRLLCRRQRIHAHVVFCYDRCYVRWVVLCCGLHIRGEIGAGDSPGIFILLTFIARIIATSTAAAVQTAMRIPVQVQVSNECAREYVWAALKQVSHDARRVPNLLEMPTAHQNFLHNSAGMQERGETGDRRENPPTSDIARHDSHMLTSGSGTRGETASYSTNSNPRQPIGYISQYVLANQTLRPCSELRTTNQETETPNINGIATPLSLTTADIASKSKRSASGRRLYSLSLITPGVKTDRAAKDSFFGFFYHSSFQPGHRIYANGNRAGRCRWSVGFLGDLQFFPAPSFRRLSIFTSITLIGSQDLAVKEPPKSLLSLAPNERLLRSVLTGDEADGPEVACPHWLGRACDVSTSPANKMATSLTNHFGGWGDKSYESFARSVAVVGDIIGDNSERDRDGNTARLARRSDEALEVRVSVARIAPSLLDLGRGSPFRS